MPTIYVGITVNFTSSCNIYIPLQSVMRALDIEAIENGLRLLKRKYEGKTSQVKYKLLTHWIL